MNYFESNTSWLIKEGLKELGNKVNKASQNINIKNDEDLYIDNKLLYKDINNEVFTAIVKQIIDPQYVRLARFFHENPPRSNKETAKEIIDTRELEIFSNMACNHKSNTERIKNSVRDYILLGSLLIPAFIRCLNENVINSEEILSITVIESSYKRLTASLNLYDQKNFIKLCKQKNIGLHFIIEEDASELLEKTYTYYSEVLPTAIYGLCVLREPIQDERVADLDSWLFSQTGFSSRLLAGFGFTSDETNQIIQYSLNYINLKERMMLRLNKPREEKQICTIAASGPSIDETIDYINDQKTTIIATHSSIGTLLKKNILPDYLVVVERNSTVADLLKTLMEEYPRLKNVVLIAALTVDPRILRMFDIKYLFLRPRSTAAALEKDMDNYYLPTAGPESVNCAIEVAYYIGFRSLLLVGADCGARNRKYPRSINALGDSPRILDLPISGNKKRTIFSQPSLILVRDTIEWFSELCVDLKIYRIGEGAKIKGTIELEVDSDELRTLQENSYKEFDKIRKLDSDLLDAGTDRIRLELEEFRESLKNHINNTLNIVDKNYLTIHTIRELCQMLDGSQKDSETNYQLAARRLLRQVLFLSSSLLYDCSTDSKEYRYQFLLYKQSCMAMLESITLIINALIEASKQGLRFSNSWKKELKEYIE
ncbi:6-hydroxymethylpterin diphosphokinase MptE-like protein [Prochlorococcus sp. MIT 1306]|uniref:6-hydroxymethylpterin diphosphokinase MptE-like protein n=1 Tax=Prochlorococcus sp. MIT 1306 TaxID=1799667 RepID=UPI0012E72FC2|nr:6-hydroxymethylpterin diphosphokinase MptE-like protein [Prochlorococcus sp. MIT 1306]